MVLAGSISSAPGRFPLSGRFRLHSSPGAVADATSLVCCSGRGTAVIGSSAGGKVDHQEGEAQQQPSD